MDDMRLIALDPGHFHAALIQKQMYPWVSRRVAVYAPLGPDLINYLNAITRFNTRPENPTAWELEIHAAPDFFKRMVCERPGNVVAMAGRNPKIDRILGSIEAGLHVLFDKPWILEPADLPKLEAALDAAERKGLVACDIMTERFEITSILARGIVNDRDVFGEFVPGSVDAPGITAASVHHVMKLVAGVPVLRPAWFFDIRQQGEGLSDVGTHVVDLVQWTAFPDRALDYRADIRVLEGRRWPLPVTRAQFRQVTAMDEFPGCLSENITGDRLDYYCNNLVRYTLRGIHVELDIRWNWESPTGDSYEAAFRGTKARAEIRQDKEENHRPELYIVPEPAAAADVLAALRKRIAALQSAYTGVRMEELAGRVRIRIPDRYRVGHEAHFAQVTNQFFEYLQSPGSMPAWERPNMLAKYYVSTQGVELSRERAAQAPGP